MPRGGAESGALGARQIPSEADSAISADTDLAHLIAAWPTLPEADRASILAIIDRAAGGGDV